MKLTLKSLCFLGVQSPSQKWLLLLDLCFQADLITFSMPKWHLGYPGSEPSGLREHPFYCPSVPLLELWFRDSILSTYSNWKTIVKTKILEKEADDWFRFCSDHPSMRVAQTCLENISPYHYPDLVSRLHVQIILMGNFGLNGGVFWLTNGTDGELCLFCKNIVKMSAIFSRISPALKIILNLSYQT